MIRIIIIEHWPTRRFAFTPAESQKQLQTSQAFTCKRLTKRSDARNAEGQPDLPPYSLASYRIIVCLQIWRKRTLKPANLGRAKRARYLPPSLPPSTFTTRRGRNQRQVTPQDMNDLYPPNSPEGTAVAQLAFRRALGLPLPPSTSAPIRISSCPTRETTPGAPGYRVGTLTEKKNTKEYANTLTQTREHAYNSQKSTR